MRCVDRCRDEVWSRLKDERKARRRKKKSLLNRYRLRRSATGKLSADRLKRSFGGGNAEKQHCDIGGAGPCQSDSGEQRPLVVLVGEKSLSNR